MLPVDPYVEQRVPQLLVGELVRLRQVDQVLKLGVRDRQTFYCGDGLPRVPAGLVCEDEPHEREVLYLGEVLVAYLQRGIPCRIVLGER